MAVDFFRTPRQGWQMDVPNGHRCYGKKTADCQGHVLMQS